MRGPCSEITGVPWIGRYRTLRTSLSHGPSTPFSTGLWPSASRSWHTPPSVSRESTGRLKSSPGHRQPMSELGERGARRIDWARDHMPVLAAIRDELKRKKTLRGLRIGMALHVEAKTGVLALSLREAGASVRLASCNPLATDDSVATALAETHGLEVYARKWQSNEEYYENLHKVLDLKPELVIDDGADLVFLLHTKRTDLLPGVRGGNEETTTGVIRLRAMERDGALRFPIIDVYDAEMQHLFHTLPAPGPSALDRLGSPSKVA